MQCPFCKAQVPSGSAKCPQCSTLLPASLQVTAGDFGASFSNATTIWKDNLGDLVLLTLVFCLVAWVPIANVGFIAGYTRSLLKVFRCQGKASISDIFNAWDCFGNLLVYLVLYLVVVVLLSFIPFLGTLAVFALYFIAAPGILAIIDKNLGAIDAFKWSLATIQKDAVNWLLAILVGGMLGSAGAIALGIGIIITLPWGQLLLISQYEAHKFD
jgi:hypothetical protein